MTGGPYGHKLPPDFSVDLPAGGRLFLHSLEETDLWEESSKRYVNDYQLTQQNDLLLLGAILSQQLAMFRAQQRMNGHSPELDATGRPTGNYIRKELKVSDMGAAQSTIVKASVEIRELEKALGIDKKAQPLDARVLTPHGWTTIGELTAGDLVIGSAETPVEVTGVYPQGLCDIYRIHFSDGASVEADGEHLWAVSCARDEHSCTGVRLIKRTSDLAATLGSGSHLGGTENPWYVPRLALDHGAAHDKLAVLAVEPAGRKPARCISVAAADGLYVTNDYVLTHNTREAGGAHTIQNYVGTLKTAARQYGLHLSKRMQGYERVVMEARWKLRLLKNGDAEDRSYHKLTPQTVCNWLEEELAKLEELDRKFATEKAAVFIGRF